MANGTDNVISGFNNNERLTNSVTHTIAGSGNIGNARDDPDQPGPGSPPRRPRR